MHITILIPNLGKHNAQQCEQLALSVDGVTAADTWHGRAEFEIRDADVESRLREILASNGYLLFQLPLLPRLKPGATNRSPLPSPILPSTVTNLSIDGMTCHSCEITVERKIKKLPWVKKVDVDAARGNARIICREGCEPIVADVEKALEGEKYAVGGVREKKSIHQPTSGLPTQRPSFMRLVALFALVLLASSLFEKLGLFGSQVSITGSMTLAAAIILGLVAGSSSCLAVSGGLLLSSAAKFRKRYGEGSLSHRMKPVMLFVAGRTASYAVLGGMIGILGTAFTFSPTFTGAITVVAAAYMLIMGLEMLHIAPRWMKTLLPRMPKSLSHRILDAQGHEHWSAPFLLGAATFFLPCGFTQSLQIYALTTGSFWGSASILGGFALGTAPALLALGWASSSLKGKAGTFFFQFSGALVIVLGLFNLQNGLTIAGYPISFSDLEPKTAVAAANTNEATDPNVVLEDGTQVIRMRVTKTSPYYAPSNSYTVEAGKPVRMEIDGSVGGCRSVFQIPKLGVSEYLDAPPTIITFTPKSPGAYTFSCSMGMYRGTLNVI